MLIDIDSGKGTGMCRVIATTIKRLKQEKLDHG